MRMRVNEKSESRVGDGKSSKVVMVVGRWKEGMSARLTKHGQKIDRNYSLRSLLLEELGCILLMDSPDLSD